MKWEMSRALVFLSLLGVLVAGVTASVLSPTGRGTVDPLEDKVGTSGKNVLTNAPEVDLSSEKNKLKEQICSAPSVSAPKNISAQSLGGTQGTSGTRPVILVSPPREQTVQKLPHNMVKEVEKTEKNENVSPTVTLTTTEERDIVKDSDTNKTKDETIIHKEAKTEKTPSNGTVTKTVEHKVKKGEDGKNTGKETVSEKETTTDKTPSDGTVSKTVEHKVVKGDDMDEEIEERKEEPVIGDEEAKVGPEVPANTTVKKTIVEHKVVKEEGKEGNIPITVVDTEKETKTEPATTEIKTESKIDESLLDKSDGPELVVLTEKKVEKFPGNETKEVVVEEKAEKLPSNDIVKKTTVEEKTVKETSTDGEEPKKDIVIKKEIVEKTINKTEAKETPDKPSSIKWTNEKKRAILQELKECVKHVKEKAEREQGMSTVKDKVTGKTCLKKI